MRTTDININTKHMKNLLDYFRFNGGLKKNDTDVSNNSITQQIENKQGAIL